MKAALLFASLLMLAPLPLAAQTVVNGQPSGEGDPNQTVCRTPQLIPGTRNQRGPQVCKTNAVWAQYREDGMMISADGRTDIPVPKTKNCQSGGSAGGGTGSGRGMAAGISCE